MKSKNFTWNMSSWIYPLSLIWIGVVILHVVPIDSKPVTSQDTSRPELSHLRHRRSKDINDNLLMYLMKFGYLPQSDLETGNLRTEEQIRDAIRTMQAFAHLPVTGVADEQTRQLMKKPRCGLPDIISDSYRSRRSVDGSEEPDHSSSTGRRRHWGSHSRIRRYTVQGQKWHYTNLTWSVRKGTRHMDLGNIQYQVRRALELWSRASRLTFEEINSEDADIRIYFHTGYHNDGYPFDGKGTLLAHAFFPGSGIGGDAHFDDDEHWTPNSEDGAGLSFFAVAAHEFGHSLGLSHSSVQGAIMFPYYQTVHENYSLSHDDVTGIQAIYGVKTDGTYPRFPATVSPTKPPTPTKKPIYPTKPTARPPSVPTPPTTSKPNACDTSYDAISIIRRDVFIFKGKYFWRISDGRVVNNAPMEIRQFWFGFPSNLTHIDAVYEKPTQGKEIIFFVGKNYWVFTSNNGTGPYPITQLGLPDSLEKLDGAMVWGHNGKTYFFSGTAYWRFDEEVGKVELDYPRDMSMWRGVPYNIDSVFQYSDAKTYFFKGKGFWKFNDRKMSVVDRTPVLSAPHWMGCAVGMQTLENVPEEERYAADSSALSIQIHVLPLIITALITTQLM